MHIAMISSEAAPFMKTGGMGEVVFGLAKELAKLHEVSIIMPLYKGMQYIKEDDILKKKPFRKFFVNIAWRREECEIYKMIVEGVNYYFIRSDRYFMRDHGIYSYHDDIERFAFFTYASLDLLASFKNNKAKIVHLHDWHAGLLPFLAKEEENYKNNFSKTKFVLTIHNPAYQGLFDVRALEEIYELDRVYFDDGRLEFKGMVSTLKAAICYSDIITTVSKTYRDELLSPEHGMGFQELLKEKKDHFIGIANGIDTNYYDPEKDIYAKHYSIENYSKGKLSNKKIVLEELGLSDESKPLIGFVSRFTWQKGLGLIFASLHDLVNRGANIVIMGSGEKELELYASNCMNNFPNNIKVIIGYDERLAHLIYAGSDFTLVPSLFEPCGTSQLIALRYGSIPIVRATGGLIDSVVAYDGINHDSANGFNFVNFDASSLLQTLNQALDIYYDNKWLFKRLIRNGMKTNNSWKKYAKLYLRAYNKAIGK